MFESDKIMFEIYREAGYGRQYGVVYFTELTEHNKEAEINRAMAGEHFYDGFLKGARNKPGKAVISDFLERLNNGESISPEQLEAGLADFLAV
jgi:hypothetical protein